MIEGFIGPADVIEPTELVIEQTSNIFEMIMDLMNKALFFQIIAIIVLIGKCIFSFINFFIQNILWFFKDFIIWMFVGKTSGNDKKAWTNLFTLRRDDKQIKAPFLCWLIRYIITIAYSVAALPKCFLWYFLDTAGWVLYLPFRFIFWLIDWLLKLGIVKAEKKGWDFLNQIDYFVHGKPKDNFFMYQYKPSNENIDSDGNPLKPTNFKDPNTLGLGFHIIHFPDSVMYQCYTITPYSLLTFPPYPMNALIDLLTCFMKPF
jgi:hypothetical protein